MSNPAQSLNNRVEWHGVLSSLGSPSTQWTLPAQASCPLCSDGVITVYEDFVVGGQWHHCPNCNSSGDLIELASRAWNLSIQATIVKLGRTGFDLPLEEQPIEKFIEQHVEYRQRLAKLWDDARTQMLAPSHELEKLKDKFKLHSAVPKDRWQKGPGSLLGSMDTQTIERTFAPGVMLHADENGQRSSPSEHAIFQGGDWNDALVLPYYDLPGRISGFLFVGRSGRSPDDFVYRRANLGPRGNQYCSATAEVGLAMHPEAIEVAANWNHFVVATTLPMTGLSLQMRNFEQSQRALPLIVWTDSLSGADRPQNRQRAKTTNAWQMLGNRQVIFWMPEFCLATIKQAIAINGRISTVGPRNYNARNLKDFIRRYTPQGLTTHIMDSSKDWPSALSKSFGNMSNTVIERHCERMQLDGIDVEQAIKKCSSDAQQRVRGVLRQAPQRTVQTTNGGWIVERAGQWHLRHSSLGTESMISDGIQRIDCLLNHDRTKKPIARGRIIYEQTEVKFQEPLERIEKGGFHWMREVLLQKGVGFLRFPTNHRGQMVEVANIFHQPTIETAITAVGWNEKYRQFVFPKFSIENSGEVIHPDNLILDRPIPARNLNQTGVHPNLHAPTLDLSRETTQLFWAVLSCMIANVTAPACHQSRAGIALCGTGAEIVGTALASALGCIRLEMGSAKDVRQALDTEQLHHWPLLGMARGGLQRRHRRELLRREPNRQRNLVFSVDWCDARLLAIDDQWHVVEWSRAVDISPALRKYAKVFIIAYLQDLSRRRLSLGDWTTLSDCHAENVLKDMGRFVRERGGKDAPILAAAEKIRPAQRHGHAAVIVELAAQWRRTGKLSLLEDDGKIHSAAIVRMEANDAYRFPHLLLSKLTKDAGVDIPTSMQVTAMLDNAGVLVEKQHDAWLIKGDWFKEHLEAAAVPLQIVG
jgi:hypothetical protein